MSKSKTSPYTSNEQSAVNTAHEALIRAMQDDIPIEMFNLVLANYTSVSVLTANARYERILKLNRRFRFFRK